MANRNLAASAANDWQAGCQLGLANLFLQMSRSSHLKPAGGGDRNAIPLYDFPRQRIVHHFIKEMPLRVSALRTLGAYSNVFAIKSFLEASLHSLANSGTAPLKTSRGRTLPLRDMRRVPF